MEWPGTLGLCSLGALLVSLGLGATRRAFGMRAGRGVFLAVALLTFAAGLAVVAALLIMAFAA